MPKFEVTVEHTITYILTAEAEDDDKAMDNAVRVIEDALSDGSINELEIEDEHTQAIDCEELDAEETEAKETK